MFIDLCSVKKQDKYLFDDVMYESIPLLILNGNNDRGFTLRKNRDHI